MRIGLSTDFGSSRCAPQPSQFSIPVGLDDDAGSGCGTCSADGVGPVDPRDVLPTLTVRARTRSYIDDDGNARFLWDDVVSGPALLFERRTEVNDATGQTAVQADAVLAFEGDAPKETAVVWDSRGHRWEILSCRALPGRLELRLEWIDDAE